MNKYLVRAWVEERIHNLRTVWVEADSFSVIQNMSSQEFADSIRDFDDIVEQDFWYDGDENWDIESLVLDEEHSDNITPPDEKPDKEDIDPNSGRDDR